MEMVTASGSMDGSPLAHDYWKRAVYRAAPKHFSVEVLPPQKHGSHYSYGMRVSPVLSSAASTKSSFMNATYDIWRRWDDCLWFQDAIESEYSVLSRQKRQRLLEGKGVKKNGIYIQDRASSWESLPPGPDPKSVKKDIHEHLPKLTKRGSLFRTSMVTIEQRAEEFRSLIDAFLSDDVPALVAELRENRAIRDFFGYWRRDHDLLMKQKPVPRKGRETRLSAFGALTSHVSPSTNSLSRHSDASSLATATVSTVSDVKSRSTVHTGSEAGAYPSSASSPSKSTSPTSYAPSLNSRFGLSRGPASMSSFSSYRTRHVPDIEVITVPPASPTTPPGMSSGSSTSSSSTRSGPMRSRAASVPYQPKAYNVNEDFPLFLSSSTRDVPAQANSSQRAPPPVPARPRFLEALPEEQELGTPSPATETFEHAVTSPLQRRRAQSLGGAANRSVVVLDDTLSQLESDEELANRDTATSSSENERNSSDIDPGLTFSTPTLSTISLQSRRSSWRHAPRSRPSSTSSAVSGISSFDIDISSFTGPSSPSYYATRSYHPRKASIITVDSAEAIIPRYVYEPRQDVTVPEVRVEGWSDLRRSVSSSSSIATRRTSRPRSNSQPLPHTPADERFSLAFSGGGGGVDSWMELGDDFMNAYFVDAPREYNDSTFYNNHGEDAVDVPSAEVDSNILFVPEVSPEDLDIPQTPYTPTLDSTPGSPLNTRRQQMALSLSSELFHQPLRSGHSSRVSGLSAVQFQLPFTPLAHATSETSLFPTAPTTPVPAHEAEQMEPSTSPCSPDDAVVVKVACGDTIVQFRMPRSASLFEARTRVAQKFTSTDGILLPPGFLVFYVPPMARGRTVPTHASTVSAASMDWERQVVIETEDDWRVAVGTCGPKLVLRVGDVGAI